MQGPWIALLLSASCAAPPAWAAVHCARPAGRLGWAALAALAACTAWWAADPLAMALLQVDGRLSGAGCSP